MKRYIITSVVLILLVLILLAPHASNERNWEEELNILAYEENGVLHNVRNQTYSVLGPETLSYYNLTLAPVRDVFFLVEPFWVTDIFAHTFLVFEFEDNNTVGLSIEARKEIGESYSAVKGLFRQYELIYVWASEQDLANRRAVWLSSNVYMYPLNISNEVKQNLLLSLIEKTNTLVKEPAFYNTITSSCTTELAKHAATFDSAFVYAWQPYVPGTVDALLYERKLIPHDAPLEEIRSRYNITACLRDSQTC